MLKHIFFFLLLFSGKMSAQPFFQDIRDFKMADSLSPEARPKNAILFIGSSSFRLWRDVQDYFPEFKIINRGFGGSSLPDLIRYEMEIIFPYQPRQIVIYCGENDLAGDTTATGETVFERFKILFTDIRKVLPEVNIGYISMKPSPSRMHLMEKVKTGNRLIEQFLKTQPETFYTDVFSEMLKSDGSPDASLFVEDMLHMNKNGYAIWQPGQTH